MANHIEQQVRGAAREAERMAPGSDWLETFARVGYAAKGVVYTVVGILAVQAAFGSGGQAPGSRSAVREIASQPFGQTLLVLTALGLLCYGIWRLVMAALDPRGEGTDAEGIVKRLGYAASGLINAALAVFALSLVFGSGGGGGGTSEQTLTAQLMSKPFGLWIVGLIGAVILGLGLYHFRRAYKASFMEKYKIGAMSGRQRRWARRIGQVGLSARGVAFSMIGVFFIQAALQRDPSEAGGLEAAFQTLLRQPYGPWLLGVVALGFVCYGMYCFSYARYRHFHTQTRVS